MKITCNIINDLLPLYADNVLSDDSRCLVDEHIGKCESCRSTAEKMSGNITIPENTSSKDIKLLKKHISRKRITAVCVSSLITLLVVFCLCVYVLYGGNAASSDNVAARTEFQYSDSAYLNQEWVIHFMLTNGKPITAFSKAVWEKNSSGTEVYVGEIIYIRELPVVIHGASESSVYTTGYSCEGYDGESDFTVTVVYKDKSVVYSMREEGLYEKQTTKTFPWQ